MHRPFPDFAFAHWVLEKSDCDRDLEHWAHDRFVPGLRRLHPWALPVPAAPCTNMKAIGLYLVISNMQGRTQATLDTRAVKKRGMERYIKVLKTDDPGPKPSPPLLSTPSLLRNAAAASGREIGLELAAYDI